VRSRACSLFAVPHFRPFERNFLAPAGFRSQRTIFPGASVEGKFYFSPRPWTHPLGPSAPNAMAAGEVSSPAPRLVVFFLAYLFGQRWLLHTRNLICSLSDRMVARLGPFLRNLGACISMRYDDWSSLYFLSYFFESLAPSVKPSICHRPKLP